MFSIYCQDTTQLKTLTGDSYVFACYCQDTTQLKSLTGDSYVFACDGPTFNAIMTKDPELFKKIVHRKFKF